MIKGAGAGISTTWHQDPTSTWDDGWTAPGFDTQTCGFSFHGPLYHYTPENALWILPGR